MVERKRKSVSIDLESDGITEEIFEVTDKELPVMKRIEPVQPVVQEQKPIRWKKIGNGTFLFKNHFIKPNQIFIALEDEIPKQFRDLIVPVDKIPEPVLQEKDVRENYQLEQLGDGKYNIVDLQGKKLNESALTITEAKNILKVL
jgi:hypothetical protein